MYRTDLVVEAAQGLAVDSAHRRNIGGVAVTDVRLTGRSALLAGKPSGRYITIEGTPEQRMTAAVLKRALEQLIPPRGRLFAAGLGNPDVVCDSLGAHTARWIRPHRGSRYSLAALETDVAARTGIETAALVRAAAREIRAQCVIVIDALSCRDPRRIARSVQLTDSGLAPASGVGGRREELSARTVGVPVVAVGVPMAAELSGVTRSRTHGGFMVTAGDIDCKAELWAETIAQVLMALARESG